MTARCGSQSLTAAGRSMPLFSRAVVWAILGLTSKLRRLVEVDPTHWQEWTEAEHHNQ